MEGGKESWEERGRTRQSERLGRQQAKSGRKKRKGKGPPVNRSPLGDGGASKEERERKASGESESSKKTTEEKERGGGALF